MAPPTSPNVSCPAAHSESHRCTNSVTGRVVLTGARRQIADADRRHRQVDEVVIARLQSACPIGEGMTTQRHHLGCGHEPGIHAVGEHHRRMPGRSRARRRSRRATIPKAWYSIGVATLVELLR